MIWDRRPINGNLFVQLSAKALDTALSVSISHFSSGDVNPPLPLHKPAPLLARFF